MPSLQAFCDAMRWAADSDRVGYSQSDRYSLGPGDFFGGGWYNTDCSALTIAAAQYAGFPTGWATYTGNMSAAFCANGWERLPVGIALKAGDVLLSDANHVAVWLGDCLAQASIDEHGNIAGGARGDQTGAEVNTRSYYDYPWDCVLRYAGPQDEEDDMRPADVWEYDYKGSAPGGNMYNCMLGMNAKLDALTAAVEVLAEAKGVDSKAVVKAVDKAVREKLAKIKVSVSQ